LVVVREFKALPRYVHPEGIEYIRAAWKKYAMPRLPRKFIKDIPKMMVEGKRYLPEMQGKMTQRMRLKTRHSGTAMLVFFLAFFVFGEVNRALTRVASVIFVAVNF
jgi:hypothetical protein